MPSTDQLIRRLEDVERRRNRAMTEVQTATNPLNRAKGRLRDAQEAYERERRSGSSQARASIRESASIASDEVILTFVL